MIKFQHCDLNVVNEAHVPSCTDNQVRMDSPLSLVQSVYKGLLLSCAHLHDIPPYWSEVIGAEVQRAENRERGVVEVWEEPRKRQERRTLLKINTDISFPQQ